VEKAKNELLQPIDLTPFVQLVAVQGLPITKDLQPYIAHAPIVEARLDSDPLKVLEQEDMHTANLAENHEQVQEESLNELLTSTSQSSHRSNVSVSSQVSNGLLNTTTMPLGNDITASVKGKAPASSLFPITSRSSTEDVQKAIAQDFDETSHALMRLPLDLPSLELLTNLLERQILVKTGADAPTITREYIQHCLRIIERLGATFSPTSDTGDGLNGLDAMAGIPSGREEQVRAVKLLIMFMKNLLKKGLLPVQELQFDLDEICIRYIWVADVREFRKFLEGGDMVDTTHQAAVAAHGVGG
jgi:hypothetical protein